MPFANLTTNADVDDANADEHQCRMMRLTNGEENAQLFACTSLFAAWGGTLPNCTLPYGDIVSWFLEFGKLDPSVDSLVWNSTYIDSRPSLSGSEPYPVGKGNYGASRAHACTI